MEKKMETTVMGYIGLTLYPETLKPKPCTLNSSFHFLFHYPYITPNFCAPGARGTVRLSASPEDSAARALRAKELKLMVGLNHNGKSNGQNGN